MAWNWEKIAEADEIYKDISDYKQAAYQLITEQILYESNNTQRKAYRVIQAHYSHFKDAVSLFGLALFHNPNYRYYYVVPKDVRQVPISLEETLLILVLRQLYHERASKGELDEGRAIVAIEDLKQAYKVSTGRELPSTVGELKQVIQQLRRYGIARAIEPEPDSIQPFDIGILPGIEELVNETAVSKLGAYLSATNTPLENAEVDDEEA